MKNWTIALKLCVVSVVTCVSLAFSQKFPDTIWVPVTFYDFHSDRSNPEFEQPHAGAVRTGMVDNELGPDGKPQVGAEPYMNYYISKWFKPWKAGDYTVPQYDTVPPRKVEASDEFNREVTYFGEQTVEVDTAFKNVVIYDSLPFIYDRAGGFYTYKNDEFFPLDGRGFGNEWNAKWNAKKEGHNFSFTMELHWAFVKEPGMKLTFQGDDDIWVFIDKKLQIDIGGIHNREERSVNVDDIEGLKDGEVYDLDIFYAERHSEESHIWITTNIIFAQSLRLYKEDGKPDFGTNTPLGSYDTVMVGEPYTIYGHVFDSVGVWIPESDSGITWEIRSGSGGELSSQKGVSTTFTCDEADAEVTISAQYKDPKSGNVSVKTITLYVKSDKEETKSYKLELYDSPDDPGSIDPASSHKTITVGEECTLYGHIFDDKTEKWIAEYDSLITWEITESKNTGLSSKEGVSTTFKSSEPNSEVTITARFIDPVSRKEIKKSIQITVKEKESYELRLYNSSGDPKDLNQIDYSKKVTIIVGEEYTLYGHIFDEAGEWVSKYDSLITWEVSKSKNLGLTLVKGKKTTFVSSEANSEVTITARFKDRSSGKESVKSVKLFIDQKAIPSYALKLYDLPGDPGNLKPISSGLTIEAGESITVYGHVFDKEDKWYKDYDKNISWKLKDVEEEGVKLEKSEGEYTSVTLTKTGTVRIVAEFVDNSNPAKPVSRAEVSITVKPAADYKVDIQKSKSDTSNGDQYNFDLLVFEKNVSIDSLYGIVRDKYGNFIRYADKASWKSGDVAIVKLIKSEGLLGIAEQQKNGVGSETIIIVSEKGLIPDTIKVSSVGEQSVVAFMIKPGERIPQTVRNYYNKLFTTAGNIQKGTLVAIETPRPLLPDSTRRDNSFGKVIVYDAVGNVVRSDLKLVPAGSSSEEKRTYGILWDYTNRNKRQVGQGAYLFVVTGRYLDSNNRTVSFKEQVKVAAITK